MTTDPAPVDRHRKLERYHAAIELLTARDQLRTAVRAGVANKQHADRVAAAEKVWDELVPYRPDTTGRAAA